MVKCSGFEITKSHSNSLLIFENSCEGVLKNKDFVKIATSRHHRKNDIIYVKLDFFDQSNLTRKTDLDRTHTSFFVAYSQAKGKEQT